MICQWSVFFLWSSFFHNFRLVALFKYWDSVLYFFLQQIGWRLWHPESRQIHWSAPENSIYDHFFLSSLFLSHTYTPFIIISLMKLLLLRKQYFLSFSPSQMQIYLNTAQRAVNLICFFMMHDDHFSLFIACWIIFIVLVVAVMVNGVSWPFMVSVPVRSFSILSLSFSPRLTYELQFLSFIIFALQCQAKSDAHREQGDIVRVLTFKLAMSASELLPAIRFIWDIGKENVH